MKTKLTEELIDELVNIGKNKAVFTGNTLSQSVSKQLVDLGLVMMQDGASVLTEAGKREYTKIRLYGLTIKIKGKTIKHT